MSQQRSVTKAKAKASVKLPPPVAWKHFTIDDKSFLAVPYNSAGLYPFPDRVVAKEKPQVDTFRIFDAKGYGYCLKSDQQVSSWRTTKRFIEDFKAGLCEPRHIFKMVPCGVSNAELIARSNTSV